MLHAFESPDEILIGRDALIREIKANDVTVLLGETGSGKTTRELLFFVVPSGSPQSSQRSLNIYSTLESQGLG